MIIANGMQKSGTHALMAWFAMMGLKRAPGLVDGRTRRLSVRKTGADPSPVSLEDVLSGPLDMFIHGHAHSGHAAALSRAKVVTVIRDPRDQAVSFARFVGQPREHGVISALRGFNGLPFIRMYRAFLDWRGKCLVLRYEDIPRDFARAVIYDPDNRHWETLNETPSRWQDWWTDRIDAEWRRLGGPQLLEEAGYT